MNDRALNRLLRDTLDLLGKCEPVLLDRLHDMRSAQNGWPATSGGAPTSGISDRTGEAAIRPDHAANDRAALEAALKSIGRQAATAVYLLARYTPRPATDRDRRETMAATERDESCSSCRRLEVAKGVARWEPIFRGDLCRWCHDWRRDTGAVPAVAELERHHRGLQVRRPA